jgi:small conductance mechanosensitive channel
MATMAELQEKFWDNLPASIKQVLSVLALVLAGWLFYRYLVGSLHKLLVRMGVSPGVVSFLFNTARALLVCAVVLAVLGQFGVQTTSLLALLGAGGAAVLLSLQGFLGNFAAGLVLLGQRMVRLGDTIEAGDVRGQVVEMLALHVVIETPEQVRVTLPNSLLVNGPMRNHSALPTRRVQWLLPIPAGLDLPPLKEALRAALRADERVLPEPPPDLFLREWAADKQTLAVQAWTRAPNAQVVQDHLLEALGKVVAERIAEGKKPAT